jgi:hypothetical protein
LPIATWFSNTTIEAEGILEPRATSPIAEIVGNPNNRLVIAVEITILPLI